MNYIFSGSFKRDDLIYDYTGVWSSAGARVSWKAIVRNASVVCRPSGEMEYGLSDEETLGTITRSIEATTDHALLDRAVLALGVR
jgi:hypothetical protein